MFVYVCLPSEAAWTVGVGRYLAQWAMDRAFIMVLTLIRMFLMLACVICGDRELCFTVAGPLRLVLSVCHVTLACFCLLTVA